MHGLNKNEICKNKKRPAISQRRSRKSLCNFLSFLLNYKSVIRAQVTGKKMSYHTFQSAVISSKENSNCDSTLSTRSFADQSRKDHFSPPGIVSRESTIYNITFSETDTRIRKNTSPHQNKIIWEALTCFVRITASASQPP